MGPPCPATLTQFSGLRPLGRESLFREMLICNYIPSSA